MRVVVFGGNGFLGSYIVMELLERGHKVTICDTTPVKKELSHLVRFISGSILDTNIVKSALTDADIVYNLAAMADIGDCIDDPVEAVKINILGNTILLDECIKHNIKRFIFSSSLYAYSVSGGMYSSTKKASEDIIKNYSQYYGLEYTILQYGTIYGVGASKDNSVYKYLQSALTNKQIKYVGDGEEVREYLHVIDAAKLGVQSIQEEYKNKTVVISGHYPMKVKDLFTMIQEILPHDVNIEYCSALPSWKKNSHYKITPYSYNRDLPTKLVNTSYIDLGTGILQLLESIEREHT